MFYNRRKELARRKAEELKAKEKELLRLEADYANKEKDLKKKRFDIEKAIIEANKRLHIENGRLIKGKNSYMAYDATARYKWHDLRTIGKFMAKHFHKDETILINMMLTNGMSASFIVRIEDDNFTFDEKTYIIDLELKYYSISSGMFCLDYHQNFSLPIKKEFNIDEIKQAIDDTGIECAEATNPSRLRQWMISSLVSKVFHGADMENKLSLMLTMIIITLAVSAIALVLGGFSVYMLSKIIAVMPK